jgi:putative hydrolase of the HAD superfamily
MSTGRTACVNALLLDALGTVVALEPPAPRLRSELARRFGIEVTEEQAAHAIAAEIRYYRSHLDDGRDQSRLRLLRERCAEVIRSALPPSPRLSAIPTSDMTDALLASISFTAFADARPAIVSARARGLKVVVASNWDVSLHEVLARLGLAELLDGIVTSAEAGARKPAAAVFERALSIASAEPAAAVHVGDSIEEDVAGARAAGLTPVLISRDGRCAPSGVEEIATLEELDGLLPQLTNEA